MPEYQIILLSLIVKIIMHIRRTNYRWEQILESAFIFKNDPLIRRVVIIGILGSSPDLTTN